MPSQEALSDVSIETGVIIDVDMAKWTVDIMTQFGDKPLFNVPWSSPYLHHERGEGIHFVPEVGAQCLVCFPADGESNPFVIGFLPIPKKDSFRSNRINMNPGDIGITTRDGNFVLCRRGGVVQIGASAICQRIFLPVADTIRDFAQNYSLTTFGGELVWEVDEKGNSSQGTPTRLVLRAKRYAEDKNEGKEYFPVVLTVGHTPSADDKTKRSGEQNLKDSGIAEVGVPVVELDITVPGRASFNLVLDDNGNLYAKGSSARWDFSKDLIYNIGRNRTVAVQGTDRVEANERVEKYERHQMSYKSSSESGQSKRIDAQQVAVGNLSAGQLPAMMGGPPVAAAFAAPGFLVAITPAGPIPVTPGPGFAAAIAQLFSTSVTIGR